MALGFCFHGRTFLVALNRQCPTFPATITARKEYFSSAHHAKQECYEPQPITNFHKPFRSPISLLIVISKNSTKLYWKIQWNLNKFRYQFLSDHGHMCPKITSQILTPYAGPETILSLPNNPKRTASTRRQLSKLRRSNFTISAKISLTIKNLSD